MEESRSLLHCGRTEDALDRLKSILSTVDPIEHWRVHELIGAAFHDLGDADGAAQAYFNAAMTDRYLRAQRQHFSNYLFALHYLPHVDAADLAAEHFTYNDLYRDVEPLTPIDRRRDKISLGYLAPDFLQSAAARFYESLLTQFDRRRFRVTCISLSSASDDFTDRIKNSVDDFIVLDTRSIENSARKIAELGLDILFDLGGHSSGGITLQLAAYRLAPVQLTGLGWFDTTGLDAIDYILTDDFLTPRGDERLFAEQFLLVPHALTFIPTPEMRPRAGRARSEFTFGCFNNFMKITDEYLECVAEILERVPHSRLIMQDTTRIAARRRRMLDRIEKLLPIERVEVRLGRDDWLADYASIDVMLDTFPYNGCAMTATALCMNVPVICMRGDRYGSRFGSDVLRAAGLSELIVDNREEYINRAIEIAGGNSIDVAERLQDSALLDTKKFVSELEAAYETLLSR